MDGGVDAAAKRALDDQSRDGGEVRPRWRCGSLRVEPAASGSWPDWRSPPAARRCWTEGARCCFASSNIFVLAARCSARLERRLRRRRTLDRALGDRRWLQAARDPGPARARPCRARAVLVEPDGRAVPAAQRVELPEAPPLSALGASAATVLLDRACRDATLAAVRSAVAQRAEAEVSAELARAICRFRALQNRWIPQHEQALAQLDLALDESQREQAARVRWLTQRRDPAQA